MWQEAQSLASAASGLSGRRQASAAWHWRQAARVVAGQAGEGAAAGEEAAALAQPVGMMIDLEAIRRRPPFLRDVHLNEVIRERLAGPEGVVAPAGAAHS